MYHAVNPNRLEAAQPHDFVFHSELHEVQLVAEAEQHRLAAQTGELRVHDNLLQRVAFTVADDLLSRLREGHRSGSRRLWAGWLGDRRCSRWRFGLALILDHTV